MFPESPAAHAEPVVQVLDARDTQTRPPRRGRSLVRAGTACMIAGVLNLGIAANRSDEPTAAPVSTGAVAASVVDHESTLEHAPEPEESAPAPAPPAPRLAETRAYGPEPEHLLDVQWPSRTTHAPAIIYVHSGGWASGTRTNIPDFVMGQLDNGWVIVSIDYRLSPEHPYPAAGHDVDRAIRWTKQHAVELGIDADRIVLAGGSAGGHLATTAAGAPGRLRDPNLPAELAAIDPRPAALIALVAPTDLAALVATPGIGGPLTADLLACPTPTTCSPEALREASPITHVAVGAPPALFLYGELDTLVPESPHGTAIAAAWRAVTTDVQVVNIAGAGHNLDLTTVDPTIVTTFLARWLTEPLQ